MLNPIAILCDPLGFIHACYLTAKVAIMRRLQPTCRFCHRESSDWSTPRPLCSFHFNEIMRVRQECQ
jgi:hypothetical protein